MLSLAWIPGASTDDLSKRVLTRMLGQKTSEDSVCMVRSSRVMKSLPNNAFRAGVGIVLVNGAGKVLALERVDKTGAWQMPQGGLRKDEDPLGAARRELREETEIDPALVEPVSEYPKWLAYELPPDRWSGKYGRGQVQKWFLFRFTGRDDDIHLEDVEKPEFSSWRWMELSALAEETALFRRPIYRALAAEFGAHLRG